MSRVADNPVAIPKGVEVGLQDGTVRVVGPKGELQIALHSQVEVRQEDEKLLVRPRSGSKLANAQAGTARALVNNMVTGVSQGFSKKLELVGVGYRAQMQGSSLNLSLGFSHPVNFAVPEGITIKTPSPTEILIEGIDKQQVGQVAANVRAYRPPEPYKGKGVKYADEVIVRKEAKKK
jgi:large subunit ribosomal protein L6